MPRNTLTITPAPYKSSCLAIPPTPFSPLLPITPPPPAPSRSSQPQPNSPAETKAAILVLSPPPSEPLNWLWQCHVCTRVYQLGATRRCLDDGHFFCAGTTTVKRSRKTNKRTVKHKACASEFDYQGWKNWGVWRRGIEEKVEAARSLVALAETTDGEPMEGVGMQNGDHEYFEATEKEWFSGAWKKDSFWRPKKNCWGNCDYPSECWWGKQYGVSTPTAVPSSSPNAREESVTSGNRAKKAALVTFDDILDDGSVNEANAAPDSSTDTDMSDGHLVEDSDGLWTTNGDKSLDRKPSLDDLLASVKRRKRKSAGGPPSPLGSNPPSPTAKQVHDSSDANMTDADDIAATIGSGATASVLQKAFDDFELDVKKSFERAGGLVAGWASSLRGSASSTSLPGVATSSNLIEDEDSKVDGTAVVKALRLGRKKAFSLGGSDVMDL